MVTPDCERKVLGRRRPVNLDRTRLIPGDNASISRNTEPVSEVERTSPSARGNQSESVS